MTKKRTKAAPRRAVGRVSEDALARARGERTRMMQRRVRDERKIHSLTRALERAVKRSDVRLVAMIRALAPALNLDVVDPSERRTALFPSSRAAARAAGDVTDDADADAALAAAMDAAAGHG